MAKDNTKQMLGAWAVLILGLFGSFELADKNLLLGIAAGIAAMVSAFKIMGIR